MKRKKTGKQACLVSFVLAIAFAVVSVAGGAAPLPNAGWWMLDEGSGTTVRDSSGQGRHGTVEGSPAWTNPGWEGWGWCLQFGGDNDRITLESFDLTGTGITLAAWIKPVSYKGDARIISKTEGGPTSAHYWALLLGTSGNTSEDRLQLRLRTDVGGGATAAVAPAGTEIPLDEWTHAAVTWDASDPFMRFFRNGDEIHEASKAGTAVATGPDLKIGIGNQSVSAGAGSTIRPFDGFVDDVRVYDYALSLDEIGELLVAVFPARASVPSPGNGAEDALRAGVLGWRPGTNAETHDVYLGTVFSDVNDANRIEPLGVLASQDQDANTLDVGRLEFGQTYYWRVDEVNGPPDFTVFPGAVWSFTVEPISYPISNVTASASSSHNADMGPEKTVDGSGLDDMDQHGTLGTDMWLSGMGDAVPWIEYAFDRAYKLHQVLVWNSNQIVESFIGLGAKEVTIETSIDGAAWTVLEGATLFNQASGKADYIANTAIDFGGVMARYVRIMIQAGHGPTAQYGLSEVRFMHIPVRAREPQPQDGALTEGVDFVLGWWAGREAAQHEVVLSSDLAAVEDGSAVVGMTQESSFRPDAINYDTTYYWQIIEVNDAEVPARHAGDIWSFSTPEYRVVDDFEGYDDDCDRIFFAWEDGFGHNGSEGIADCTVAPYNGNGTGSIVGNANAPFAEQTIVHSGRQSMPLEYDTGVSEATLALDGQNWTVNGIQWLSLYVYGTPDNTGQLYLKINNTKVPFDGNPIAVSRPLWTVWNVELSTLGVDLTRVNTLTIGIENASTQGMLYVDDIRLYGQAPGGLPAQDPGTDSLVAHYALENNTQDGSGNGHHGTPVGDPIYAAGITGNAMDFDAIDDRIDLGPLDVVGSGITLALWLNPDDFLYDDTRVISKATSTSGNDHWWMISTSGGGHVLRFRLKTDDGQATTTLVAGSGGVAVGEWTHAAAVWDGSTMRILQNLQEVGSTAKGGAAVAVDPGINAAIGNQPEGAGDKHWDGLIDEVRVYSRGLSEAELLHIALQ